MSKTSQISFTNWHLFSVIVGFILILIEIAVSYQNPVINRLLALLTIMLNIINLIKSRNDLLPFLLNFQIFYINYSIIFSKYLHETDYISDYYKNVGEYELGIGITCLFLFEFIITLAYKKCDPFQSNFLYAKKKNELLSAALLFISLLIGIFEFDRSIYGQRFAGNQIYEYNGILLILGLHYSGSERKSIIKVLYTLLIFLLSVQGLIFGERIAPLQFILIWFIFFLGDKVKPKDIMPFLFIGIFLMLAVGVYRTTYSLSDISLEYLFSYIKENMFIYGGAVNAYYTSLTFILFAKQTTILLKASLFLKFIISLFVGNSPEASLAHITFQYYHHNFGGLYPFHFMYYGGIPLVVLMSLLWSKFFYFCIAEHKRNNSFFMLTGIYIVCMTMRWYVYTPLNAFRSTALFVLAFYMVKIADSYLRKSSN